MALITALSGVGGGITAATVGAQVNFSVLAQSAQTAISGLANSQTTYTSGTVSMSELGAITIRSTTGNQYQFSVPTGASATGNVGGVAASNSTITSGTVVISGSNNLTASYNGQTILLSVPTQSAQTFVSGIAGSNTTYTSGVVSITGVGGGVTVSSNTGQRIDISVAAPVAQSTVPGNIFASSQTFGASSSSSYDLRTLTIYGSGGVSVGWSNGSLGISGQTTAAQSVQTLGIYASSQTFGASSSSTYSAQSLSVYASGGISAGWSNGSFGLSVPAGASATGNLGGIAASNTTFTSGTVVISGANGITVGSGAQTVQISGPGPMSFYHANSAVLYSSATSAPINTSVSLVRMQLDAAVSFSRVDIPVSVSLNTAATTATNAIAISAVGVLYSRNASTLNAIVGQSSTTTISYASNTGVFSSVSGPRLMSFNLATSLSAGEYYFGFQLSTANSSVGASTTNLGGTIGMVFGSTMTAAPWLLISADPTVSTINALNPMQGMNSVSISATSQTHQASQVTVSGTQLQRAGLMVILRNIN